MYMHLVFCHPRINNINTTFLLFIMSLECSNNPHMLQPVDDKMSAETLLSSYENKVSISDGWIYTVISQVLFTSLTTCQMKTWRFYRNVHRLIKSPSHSLTQELLACSVRHTSVNGDWSTAKENQTITHRPSESKHPVCSLYVHSVLLKNLCAL